VVKAEDLSQSDDDSKRYVGIKIVRMRDIMIQAGMKEKEVLAELNEDDEKDQRFIVRMLESFHYRKHLCIVFEYLHSNLREILKAYGKNIGLSLEGVRMYATQLFIALAYLRKHSIIHADIKPDNILVPEDLSKIKLCDFGTAFKVEERAITEYLASGYYRAPEVMIGCLYDTQIDVWASAVSLFEIYTGNVMFAGNSNTEMLRLIMEVKGRINSKMLRKGEYTSKHFDHQNRLLVREIDPVTKNVSIHCFIV
jgi:serine/threonine-protein kinase PRP4